MQEQTVCIDESMVPYFGRDGCKQFVGNKSMKFGHKFKVIATCVYAIQFIYLSNLGFGGFAVTKIAFNLHKQDSSDYDIVMDNFFNSAPEKGTAETEIVQTNLIENIPLKSVKKWKSFTETALML